MYLHIGANFTVRHSDVIGIFDADTCTASQITKKFLNHSQKTNILIDTCTDIPKSFILCKQNHQIVVFISQISSATLKARIKKNNI